MRKDLLAFTHLGRVHLNVNFVIIQATQPHVVPKPYDFLVFCGEERKKAWDNMRMKKNDRIIFFE